MGIGILRFASLRLDLKRGVLPVLGAATFLCPGPPATAAAAAGQHLEKHFVVNARPVVVIHNVANGRVEVKSWKNAEVDVLASQTSDKIGFEMEQAGDRIDVTANILDASAQPTELAANLILVQPLQVVKLRRLDEQARTLVIHNSPHCTVVHHCTNSPC